MANAHAAAASDRMHFKWFVPGDINGFLGLMFDNMTVLSFLAGTLIFAFKFPADVVFGKMFPGTAFGVLFGDLVYTYMAYRLAKKTGNPKVTAMPLGLDTPSTIGIAVAILGPAFLGFKAKGLPEHDAALLTWHLGMAVMVLIGLVKILLSFFGKWVQRVIPEAGLLGSLAGVGLALLGFIPIVQIFGMPLAGLFSLGLVLYTLVAHIKLPKNFPGVLAAVAGGTAIYYLLTPLLGGAAGAAPAAMLRPGLPLPNLGFLLGLAPALRYLPIAVPFAILTVVGGINVSESARVAGDDYNTRSILLTEAAATLLAGLCGGVAQSTPYIGQPAYKHMGCRVGYAWLTGLFIGLGGILGYAGFIVELIPQAVIAPILVFVALEIMSQATKACPQRHLPAVAFAYLPNVARLLQIKLSDPGIVPLINFNALIGAQGKALPDTLVIIALGNGFILTAMLWGAFMAKLVDHRLRSAALYLLVCAGLTLFGVIHSALPDGNLYLPWTLNSLARRVPYQFASGYLLLGALLFMLSFTPDGRQKAAAEIKA